ncbi:MAG: hypothetical protein KAX38_05835, partial [Candidatus Krumholzibacteria bacterium]|nr:hypothetical protein [Candidatus Krumholzibacteria bacterium]
MRFLTFMICIAMIALPSESRSEKYAGEFMALGGGARAMGMGGAFIAVVNDATASFWNPAGIARFSSMQTSPEDWEISLMHSERFGDLIDYNFASAAFPLKSGESGWGMTFIHMGIADIRIIPLAPGMIGDSDGDGHFEPGNGEYLNFDYKDF